MGEEVRSVARESDGLAVSFVGASAPFDRAVVRGGGRIVPLGSETQALVWNAPHDPVRLRAAMARLPRLSWVQLPSAGVDDLYAAGIFADSSVEWTGAQGSYARPVAEHALALMLATLRRFPERIRAESWAGEFGRSLYGLRVVIVGAGGITQELLRLLAPFEVRTTVIRRDRAPLPGADRTMTASELHAALAKADVLVLAAPLTPQTRGLIDASALAVLPEHAVLINVARGGLVDTDALVAALRSGALSGAGLDVTDPEPLPDGHALWTLPTVIVTPHTADTPDMVVPLLAARIEENVRRRIAGEALLGRVDPDLGY